MSERDSRPDADERLLDELRGVLRRIDPVPPDLLRLAKQSYPWRTIDEELAELILDSIADRSDRLEMVRGGPTRMLTFEAPSLSIDVEVIVVGSGRRLLGQLVPPQPAEVQIRNPGKTITVRADQLGRFRATGIPPGPMSLRCLPTAAPTAVPVVTNWVST
jgi:hypothetical protein